MEWVLALAPFGLCAAWLWAVNRIKGPACDGSRVCKADQHEVGCFSDWPTP